jgi:ATP/ADP translocase
MIDALRPFISRLLAALLAGVCTWLAVRFGFTIDAATQQQLVEAIVGVIVTYMTLYAASHRVIDKRINPDDAASSHAAAAGKAKQRQRKAVRETEERIRKARLWRSADEPPEEAPLDRGE